MQLLPGYTMVFTRCGDGRIHGWVLDARGNSKDENELDNVPQSEDEIPAFVETIAKASERTATQQKTRSYVYDIK